MTHALDFSGDFFAHDELGAIAPSMRPASVYQAIVSMEEETWREIARHVFSLAPERLTADAVFRAAIETDTCSNLTSPVEVWIDSQGDYTVFVHEPIPEALNA